MHTEEQFKKPWKTHTNYRPHSCIKCGKKFAQLAHLKIHDRVHTKEKPFTCLQCKKNFTVASSLKIHQMIHTQERPFSCLDCTRSFKSRTDLKRHESVHSNEKPYCCTNCDLKFRLQSSLKNINAFTLVKNHTTALFVKSVSDWMGSLGHMKEAIQKKNLLIAPHVTKHFHSHLAWKFIWEFTPMRDHLAVLSVIWNSNRLQNWSTMDKSMQASSHSAVLNVTRAF